MGAAAAGAIAVILVAGLLTPVRDTFGNTNIALVLVVVIVAAATLGGRLVGAVTSVAAALAYNFFHTQPYRSLSVDNREDVTTVVLLLVVGLIVGELANLHSRRARRRARPAAGAHWLEQVAGLVAGGRPVDEVWPAVQKGLIDELGLASCRFEPAPYDGQLPAVQRSGRLEGPLTWAREGFELPAGGAQLAVEHGGHLFGRVVLEPTPGRGVSLDERRVAVALTDQLAVAIAMAGKPTQPLADGPPSWPRLAPSGRLRQLDHDGESTAGRVVEQDADRPWPARSLERPPAPARRRPRCCGRRSAGTARRPAPSSPH